ncbi:MAG: [FeFe] hydrogenase, group A [Propionicimonas sp.]
MEKLPADHRLSVTVNGRDLHVDDGLTILAALTKEGIDIPALCNDVRLERANGSCGLCVVEVGPDVRQVKACITPISEGMTISTHSPVIEAYRKVRLEQLLCDHNADCEPPCQQTCPDHIDVQRYLALVMDANFEAAVRVIKDRNPFPSACGRVCPHPCEANCRRNLIDDSVGINNVKRFVADWDLSRDTPWRPKLAPSTGKRIAIVGAGPSGLSAAYYAAIAGHQVTVFDRQPAPGGMMRYGIPEYRLPKAQLDAEIATITALGVQIVCGKSLGTHLRLEDLQHDFDAVYLAIGSWTPTSMNLQGENSEGVWTGIRYLERVAKGEDPDPGEVVVVVGGGNTAVDCARTALRRGAQRVILLYRRTRDQMPAEPHEVADAAAEGVELRFLAAPTSIERAATGLSVKCLEMALGEPDRSGRARPVPVEGTEFSIEASLVIGAIGQSTNTQFLFHDLPVKLNKWGDVKVNGSTLETSEPKVFAGGDCVTGPATVIEAVAAGRRAARSMNQLLSRGYVRAEPAIYNCSRGSLEDLPRDEFESRPKLARQVMPSLPAATRVTSFAEVESGYSQAEARAEAARCLRCGCKARFDCDLRTEATREEISYIEPLHQRPRTPVVRDHPFIVRDHNKCISCGRCVAACAEIEGIGALAYQFSSGVLGVGTANGKPLIETDCVSCGQCVAACPCGALDYVRERPSVFAAINDPTKVVVGFVAPAPRSVIAAEFGKTAEQASPFVAGLMRAVGFDRVFDFSFAADLTVMEETTEFLNRVSAGGVMPQFTSCCPGWVNLVEKKFPELIPHLSSCKSPQQMMGTTVKTHFAQTTGISLDDLYVVSIVPCLAKKYEAARPEFATDGLRDVDAVLTTTEFIEMIKMIRLDPDDIAPDRFDDPYSHVSGAGVIFGASGGVAEAALRMAVEKLTGERQRGPLEYQQVRGMAGVKEATITAADTTVRVAVISGLGNALPVVERVAAGEDVGYDLIEIMACPGGCIDGAGNPAPAKVGELRARTQVLFDIDKGSKYRRSQENPDVLRLYEQFYESPNSTKARQLLHTRYRPFDAATSVPKTMPRN